MTEVWRPITDYEGSYEVSNKGRVRSLDRVVNYGYTACQFREGRVLCQAPHKNSGHLQVSLHKNGKGKTKRVHNLVAEAFIGPRPKGMEVLHGGKGVSYNRPSNLKYGTHQENALDCRRDGTHGGTTVIRSDGVEFMSITMAAETTGISKAGVHAVLKGKQKTSGGYGWSHK